MRWISGNGDGARIDAAEKCGNVLQPGGVEEQDRFPARPRRPQEAGDALGLAVQVGVREPVLDRFTVGEECEGKIGWPESRAACEEFR